MCQFFFEAHLKSIISTGQKSLSIQTIYIGGLKLLMKTLSFLLHCEETKTQPSSSLHFHYSEQYDTKISF